MQGTHLSGEGGGEALRRDPIIDLTHDYNKREKRETPKKKRDDKKGVLPPLNPHAAGQGVLSHWVI